MLKVDFTNLMAETIGDENGLSKSDLDSIARLTPAAHERIQKWRKSRDAIFYDAVSDPSILEGIEEEAKRRAKQFDDLVVLGIGGSALGLRCAASALLAPFWNLKDAKARGGFPRLFVCDNIDPETFAGLLELINIKKTCFIVISKSGSTTETAAQFLIVLEKAKSILGNNWKENFVIITDPETGELRPMIKEYGIASFSIPPKLGGRYSVLSPVGLFPAACVGIDVKRLVEGAESMAERCANDDLNENPAYQIGGYHYWFDAKKKKNISVMIPYADGLMLAADWYAQLWAESLGKLGKGSTPLKALGATDQHSQIQLYMEGPKDKVITFISINEYRDENRTTRINETPKAFDYLKGHDLSAIIKAEEKATTQALTKAGRPNLTVTFPRIDARHLGEFFMLYEVATTFTGALYGVNPFDQPGVELGKKLTREILSKR